MKNKIESVLIVGGGSSGWMTAAAFARQLPNINVTLVESPNIPIIGVGESTLGFINEYMHFIGLEDKSWMKHCNATYKTSIKFTDFRENPKEKPHTFHYPFGWFDFTDKPNGLMDWFIYKSFYPETPCENFAEFYHDLVIMTDRNKMTYNENECIRNYNFFNDTAYHMDSTLFGIYLRDHICIPNGVKHIQSTVKDVTLNEMGEIGIVHTDRGDLTADLYIDCTGFKSLLLEKKLGVKFKPFSDILLNNRAIAAPIQYINKEKELESVTNCTALDAGWAWNVPLWNRLGTGYVFSSDFVSDDEALNQFKTYLKSNRMKIQNDKRVDDAEFRFLDIRHGMHEKTWEKNVVAVGLSNGFIEPIESTGLMLTHEAIMKLVNILKTRNGFVCKFDKDSFNFVLNNQFTGMTKFVSLHYGLSQRSNSPYWEHVTQNINYFEYIDESIYHAKQHTAEFELANNNLSNREYLVKLSGVPYIAAGMGYNPTDKSRIEYLSKLKYNEPYFWEKIRDDWELHRMKLNRILDRLPSHYEFLQREIYK